MNTSEPRWTDEPPMKWEPTGWSCNPYFVFPTCGKWSANFITVGYKCLGLFATRELAFAACESHAREQRRSDGTDT